MQSSMGIVDGFPSANTSYGEVVLTYKKKIKDLLVNFGRRLQIACESFNKQDATEDHCQWVKQNVSRFLEDLLGESLDLTSDEAVSDLSSLSDDSGNERNAFEDQLAQAVISKVLETHRCEVHHGLRKDRHRLSDSSPVIPEALDKDDDDTDDNHPSSKRHVAVKDTDISKDFRDLKNFVEETQSRSRRYNDYSSLDGDEAVTDFGSGGSGARLSSGFEVGHDRENEFSDLEQVFDSSLDCEEVDPDLLQMNLWVIPEETEEEVEEEVAKDRQWRENWIFRGLGGPAHPQQADDRKRIRGQDDQPQYMMMPQPDDCLAPKVGNRDVDQLSDLSDSAEDDDHQNRTDNDNVDGAPSSSSSSYPTTSEDLNRLSRHKRPCSPPSLCSASLIPSPMEDDPYMSHNYMEDLSPLGSEKKKAAAISDSRKNASSISSSIPDVDGDLDFEDIDAGGVDFIGPIVEPTQKELKLLDSLVPAEEDDPLFVTMPESVTIHEGETVRFSCRVSGTQPIDVFWYRERAEVEELEEGEDIELQVEEGVEGGGDSRHSATLYHVGKQHGGQYMCIALNEKGKAIKYLTVTVKDNKQELKKPEFLREIQDVEVLEGQSVKFRCKVKGYPPPRIHWYKDGTLLQSSKACRLEKFGNRDYLLTMDQVTMDDDAEYMVVARNVAGQARSVAQVIVEPLADGHSQQPSMLMTSKTQQVMASSAQSMAAVSTAQHGQPKRSEDQGEDTRIRKSPLLLGAAETVDPKADTESVMEDELNVVNQCLDDMERYLGVEAHDSPCTPDEDEDSFDPCVDDDDNEGPEMDKTTKAARRLNSSTLSVLQAAEEIIQQERSAKAVISTLADCQSGGSAPKTSRITEDSGRGQRCEAQTSPTEQSDMEASVSSGYGSSSLTSSPMHSDGVLVISSSLYQGDPPSLSSPPDDEFTLHLPPLENEDSSGSYREEVSLSVSGSVKPKNEKPFRPAPKTAPSGGTDTQCSRIMLATKSTSPYTESSGSSVMHLSAQKRSAVCRGEVAGAVENEAGSVQTELPSGGVKSVVLNFGPKEINPVAYSRDYEVGHREDGKADRKKWSVNLDCPAVDVVNRRPFVDEADDKVSDVGTPQVSPRSSRGGSSGSISTSHESLDSGISCTAPLSYERPQPVHMVGETREEEVPESRAEYNADSGIELPSVSRLKAMFGSSDQGSSSEGSSFRRDSRHDIHSITARSLSREQLHQLREDGSGQPPRDRRVQSRSTLQLNNLTSPFHSAQGSTPPSADTSTVRQQHSHEQAFFETVAPVPRRRTRTPSQQDSRGGVNHDEDPTNAFNRGCTHSPAPRPRSAIIEAQALSMARPGTPRARVQSDSEAGGSPGVVYRPKVRSGGISARAAFWERRIQQGEGADQENVEEHFPNIES